MSQVMKIYSLETLGLLLGMNPGSFVVAAHRRIKQGKEPEYKGYKIVKVGRNWIAVKLEPGEILEIEDMATPEELETLHEEFYPPEGD